MKRVLLVCLLVLALGVVTVSGYMRLAADGIDCQPWPACYGRETTTHAVASASTIALLQGIYWITLAGYGLLALSLFLVVRRLLALLPLFAFLLTLGGSVDSTLPLAELAQSVGGLACVAVLVPLMVPWVDEPLMQTRAGRFALVALLLLLALQVVTGTLISVRSAGAACAVACDFVWLPGALKLFDPLQTGSAIDLLRNTAGGQPLQALHRLTGIGLVMVATAGALALVPARHGQLVVLVLVTTALLGMAIAANDGPVLAVLVHALAGAIAIGLVWAAIVRSRHLNGNR
jgi:cytochrome c oxidase assembly protein subunit 15